MSPSITSSTVVTQPNMLKFGDTAMQEAEELRRQLLEVLTRLPIDIGAVINLSTRLAEFDPDFVRFSVDAGLIDRLGRELVARQETAVSELIKNAYDADATKVELLFKNVDKPSGTLIIRDNGGGMTREQLVSGFMRLSSTDKVREPVSPKFRRQRAGRKGIGRFAVQRLGEELEIITQTQESAYALRVVIDWSQFVGGTELNSIANRIEEIGKQDTAGTTLIIKNLREAWSEAALRRIYRSVSELIQPVTLRDKRPTAENRFLEDETLHPSVIGQEGTDFQISLRRDDNQNVEVINETTEVLQHALAEIEGFVDDQGHGYWSYSSKQLELDEKILPLGYEREKHDSPYPHLRNIDFKAYYFIFKSGFISRAVHKSIQDLAEQRGGLRLYRNGLRVRPYGEHGDDWLRLEASSRNRDLLPPHANYNFFGFVEIYDPTGEQFEETSSREGLLEDQPAFKELTDFVYRALIAAVSRVAEARGKKVTAGQRNWNKKTTSSEELRAAAQALEDAKQTSEEQEPQDTPDDTPETNPPTSESPKESPDDNKTITISSVVFNKITQTLNNAADTVDTQEEKEKALIEDLGMLRVLSSLGLVIGEFTHEVRQTIGSAVLNAKFFRRKFPLDDEGGQVAFDLINNLERFNEYVSYFDRTIREKNHRELEPQDLHHVTSEWLKLVGPTAQRAKIQMLPPILDDDILLTCPMHSSEWASILFNFYSNGAKAIHRAGVKGRMQIQAGREKNRIYLEFCDNGDGIPPANHDRIFNAFFTTSTPGGADMDEEDAIQGSGLGLKIVHDIALSYGGDVRVVDAPAGFNTCMRIEFPEADEEQKQNYGY